MKITEISKILEENYEVCLKKEKYKYSHIQTKHGILRGKDFWLDKRGFFFLSKMKQSGKKESITFMGIILSHNSSDLLLKIASKLLKEKKNTDFLLFQTYNIKINTGIKLIAMKTLENYEENNIKDIYEQINSLFREFHAKTNEIIDSFFTR